VSIYRLVQIFIQEFIVAARPGRCAAGDRWFVDETYGKVAGRWTYRVRPRSTQSPATADARTDQIRSARTKAAGHAFVQNHGRGHHELASDHAPRERLAASFRRTLVAMATEPRRGLLALVIW
jgi:transposase-like protein